jgi:vesicle-fusing ATPase
MVYSSDFRDGQHVLIKGGFVLTTRYYNQILSDTQPNLHQRHDKTGTLQPGTIGPSKPQREWIGLSLTGDQVTVEPLPQPPHPSAPAYLQSIDLEVGFIRPRHEIAEQFDPDEMLKNFIKAYNGIVMSVDQILIFEFHGQTLKAVVKSVSLLDLADEQRKGLPQGQRHEHLGIVMDKTDVTFIKAQGSAIKIKSSAKR